MPRETTITVDSGRIELPRRLRREFPDGSRLVVKRLNGKVVLEQLPLKPQKLSPQDWEQFESAVDAIARDFDRRGITVADLKRTLKQVRAENRAKKNHAR